MEREEVPKKEKEVSVEQLFKGKAVSEQAKPKSHKIVHRGTQTAKKVQRRTVGIQARMKDESTNHNYGKDALHELTKLEYEREIANLRTQMHDLAAQLLDQASHNNPSGNDPWGANQHLIST